MYFKNISWPTSYTFDSLMSSKSKNTVINIAKYIREASAIRELSLTWVFLIDCNCFCVCYVLLFLFVICFVLSKAL